MEIGYKITKLLYGSFDLKLYTHFILNRNFHLFQYYLLFYHDI